MTAHVRIREGREGEPIWMVFVNDVNMSMNIESGGLKVEWPEVGPPVVMMRFFASSLEVDLPNAEVKVVS